MSLTRRTALARLSNGFGLAALTGLMTEDARAHLITHTAKKIAPRARSVIFCYMSGGVSHIDSFDPKPLLEKYAGQPPPFATARTQFNNDGVIQPSHWAFKNHGQSGLPVSDLFPHMATIADDIAVVRSMTAKFSEHAQGNFFMHTGFPFVGYPSAGAWTSYGLGTESRDIPGYVVLQSATATAPHGGVGLFGNGFLPAQHQASIIKIDDAQPVPNITPVEGPLLQRRRLDFIGGLDRAFLTGIGANSQVEAAIQNYEMAWRMQSAVPELCDIRGESKATKKLYGMDGPDSSRTAYAHQCLLARRLVERGVRFIELSCLPQTLGGGQAAQSLGPTRRHQKRPCQYGPAGGSAHRCPR